MIVLIFIAFFSSRLLLSTLGVEDYGVYSIVGSIAATFTALKSLFSESVQRFLNVAKGRKNDSLQEQVAIFNTGIVIHIILAVLFVVLVEAVGLWLLENKLSIPENRMGAAHFVFHVAVVSTAISILSIPYDALVVANEKMGFYALVGIIDAVAKLGFIFLLPVIGLDYLKTYSALLLIIPVFNLSLQILYCKRFAECQYRLRIDKKIFKEVFNLSGWNFMGNISFSLLHEGINMILNIYGGVILNAARSVAYQMRVAVAQLSNNTLVAVKPKAMQMSVSCEKQEYYKVICMISRVSFMILLVVVVPLIVYSDEILDIWLKEVPEHSVLFTRLVLLGILIRSLHGPIDMMNMAVGKIKRMMIIEAVVMLCFLVMIFVGLKIFDALWLPFALLSLMEVFIVFCLVLNATHEIDFSGKYYFNHVALPCAVLMVVSTALGVLAYSFLKADTFVYLIAGISLLVILVSLLCYLFMDENERMIVKSFVKRKKIK